MGKSEDLDYNPEDKLINGPVDSEERSCQDILCLLIWVVSMVIMFSIAGIGLKEGYPSRLLVAYDIDGNGCGFNETTLEYPYIYIKEGSNLMNSACV